MCHLGINIVPGASFGCWLLLLYILCHLEMQYFSSFREIRTFYQLLFVTGLNKYQPPPSLQFCLLRGMLSLPLLHECAHLSHSPIKRTRAVRQIACSFHRVLNCFSPPRRIDDNQLSVNVTVEKCLGKRKTFRFYEKISLLIYVLVF